MAKKVGAESGLTEETFGRWVGFAPLTWHCLVLLHGKPALPRTQAHLWVAKTTRTGLRSLQSVSEAWPQVLGQAAKDSLSLDQP